MGAIGLALASALAWGAADFIGGMQSKRWSVLAVLAISYGIGVVLLAGALLVAGDPWPGLGEVWPVLAGGASGVIGIACLYRGLAIGTMSIVAPISGTSAALPVIVGIASGERPSGLQLAGIVVATVGVVLASLERHDDPIRARTARLAVLLGLAAAAGIGGGFVGLDAAGDASVWWALMVARTTGFVLIAGAALVRRPAMPRGMADARPLLVVGTLETLALATFTIASTLGLLSVVSVVSALYPVTTVILAMALLHERMRGIQAVGIVLAFAGVALLAAA